MASKEQIARSINGAMWRIARRAPADLFEELPDLPPLVVQVLHNRGLTSVESVCDFVKGPPLPHDPYLIDEMDVAVERVARAVRKRERICVYGDYDVDGVSSTAMLLEVATLLGLDAFPYIPKRLTGYGLTTEAIDVIASKRAELIITADCGSTAHEEIAYAANHGIDVLVTDHHLMHARPEQAIALLNPNAPGGCYPFTGLSGVGVAYKLVQALADEFAEEIPYPESFLDLVALGTIADVVPIRDENRAFVVAGLEIIRSSPRLGLSALGAASGRPIESITVEGIAFGLAPRLNAAGRLAHAGLALELLLVSHTARADELARELDALNVERQRMTEEAVVEARSQFTGGNVVFAISENIVPGIAGLAAARISSEFGVLAFMGTEIDGVVRGSARSPQGIHLAEILGRHAHLFERWGGHAAAAGFSLLPGNVEVFREAIVRELAASDLADLFGPRVVADGRVFPRTIAWDTYRALEVLAPWGHAHERPRFVVENVRIGEVRLVGANHLALRFTEVDRDVEAIWFRSGDKRDRLERSQYVDVAFRLDVNEYRGRSRLQMLVDDVRLRSS